MAPSQETAPMSSQESQETAPASSQELTSASQESMSQDTTSMSSQKSTTDATILDAAGRIPMEDETYLEGPTMRCNRDEERALLNLLLAGSLNQLEGIPLGYLNVLVAHINKIRKVKASQTPVPLPRVLPRLPLPRPNSMQPEPSPTSSLSEAIYSAVSTLRTSVPSPNPRMPTCPPDQAQMDQAVMVLEGINKAPGTMPDHSAVPVSAMR